MRVMCANGPDAHHRVDAERLRGEARVMSTMALAARVGRQRARDTVFEASAVIARQTAARARAVARGLVPARPPE
jgi:hypothetical protein